MGYNNKCKFCAWTRVYRLLALKVICAESVTRMASRVRHLTGTLRSRTRTVLLRLLPVRTSNIIVLSIYILYLPGIMHASVQRGTKYRNQHRYPVQVVQPYLVPTGRYQVRVRVPGYPGYVVPAGTGIRIPDWYTHIRWSHRPF